MRRAEVVRGLEPLSAIDVNQARNIYQHFHEVCGVPAVWERIFDELLGCFKTPETAIKAFRVLDTDGNGLVDARELLGALAVLSRGHLTERMTLLFDVFDLNRETEMAFDECFLMIRRTLAGLRKMVGIHSPPEKVVHNMVKQVWKQARKHRDVRINHADWYTWWSVDASCRNGLKMFVWKPEEQRGLPTPDHFVNVDYTKGVTDEDPEPKNRLMSPGGAMSGRTGSHPITPSGSRPGSSRLAAEPPAKEDRPRRASFCATTDADGNVSKPVHEDDHRAHRQSLAVPGLMSGFV